MYFNFQQKVDVWMQTCFGEQVSSDRAERNHRFLEEALELVQAGGCAANEEHQLVDYVFNRQIGELGQKVGGTMVTLARVWTKIEQIRAKQAAKSKHSPLPV